MPWYTTRVEKGLTCRACAHLHLVKLPRGFMDFNLLAFVSGARPLPDVPDVRADLRGVPADPGGPLLEARPISQQPARG